MQGVLIIVGNPLAGRSFAPATSLGRPALVHCTEPRPPAASLRSPTAWPLIQSVREHLYALHGGYWTLSRGNIFMLAHTVPRSLPILPASAICLPMACIYRTCTHQGADTVRAFVARIYGTPFELRNDETYFLLFCFQYLLKIAQVY